MEPARTQFMIQYDASSPIRREMQISFKLDVSFFAKHLVRCTTIDNQKLTWLDTHLCKIFTRATQDSCVFSPPFLEGGTGRSTNSGHLGNKRNNPEPEIPNPKP